MLPVDDFGGQGLFAAGQPPMMPQVPQMKGGGMFGSGGVGRNIAGMIGDFLMARAGMQPMFAPMLQRRQEMAMQEKQYQHRRQDSNDDWLSHQQYEDAHRAPPQPGEFERALADSGIAPGTPEWMAAMVRRRENMLDPIVMTPYGPVTRSQALGGAQPAPQGITFTPIDDGGPASPAPGGFSY